MSSVDAAVRRVAHQAATWRALDAGRRAAILQSCSEGVAEVAEEWVRLTCAAKGIPMDSPLSGEEWYTGPGTVLRHLRLYRETLLRGGFPKRQLTQTETGWKAKVFPFERWDHLMFLGLTAEVHGRPGSEPTCGTLGPGGCAAILGAGNVQSIPPLDFLYQLLKENRVVVVKLNPINDYLQPIFEKAFSPLLTAGFLAFVPSHADAAQELITHEKIDAVHLTGSEASFQRVLATPGVEQKEATAELGAVSPVLIVPGAWSKADIRFHAKQIVGMLSVNNGFNCNAPKLLVTSRHWKHRDAFLRAVRQAMLEVPKRKAWYPGAEERWTRFVREYGGTVPPHAADETPPVLLADVLPDANTLALKEEAFCSILAEVALNTLDETTFMKEAVRFVNEKVYGTLSCTVIAAPSTSRTELDAAIEGLQYGTVGLNTWAGLGFALGTTTWGAFPGHTREAPGSGLGVVHNTFLFDFPEKSVLRAPFRPWLRPPWWPGHRRLQALGEGVMRYEKAPSLPRVAALFLAAVRP
ncbi:MAG: aldehyde dehydrogenase family protein [Planctomycetota bacterium]